MAEIVRNCHPPPLPTDWSPRSSPPKWSAPPSLSQKNVKLEEAIPGVGDSIGGADLGRRRCNLIGDDPTCEVRITHASVSAFHAALIHHHNGLVYIVDLGSTGGTRLDGTQLAPRLPVKLQTGAELIFGSSPALVVRGPAVLSHRELLRSERVNAANEAEGPHQHDLEPVANSQEDKISANTAINRASGRELNEALEGQDGDRAAESVLGIRKRPHDNDDDVYDLACASGSWKRPRRSLKHGARVFISDIVDEIDPDHAMNDEA